MIAISCATYKFLILQRVYLGLTTKYLQLSLLIFNFRNHGLVLPFPLSKILSVH